MTQSIDDLAEENAELKERLAEVEAERDYAVTASAVVQVAAEARLVEVEQALQPVIDALTWALGEVRAWADDEINEADYQRACEANSAARAVLDKGEPDGEPRLKLFNRPADVVTEPEGVQP